MNHHVQNWKAFFSFLFLLWVFGKPESYHVSCLFIVLGNANLDRGGWGLLFCARVGPRTPVFMQPALTPVPRPAFIPTPAFNPTPAFQLLSPWLKPPQIWPEIGKGQARLQRRRFKNTFLRPFSGPASTLVKLSFFLPPYTQAHHKSQLDALMGEIEKENTLPESQEIELHDDAVGEVVQTQGLKRDLHARHINMIALAGMIVSIPIP
jgi:hypothetical protein